MIVDGKEVNINYKQAQFIQNKVDNSKYLPETTKVEVNKKEIKELNNSLSSGIDLGSLYGDSYSSWNNSFSSENGMSIENRREYYDTFQEMSECNFIHRGLQVIADDGCQKNIDGNTVKIYSDDEDIKNILDELFNERLNLNKELWSIFYETCKLGDNFYEIIPDSYEKPTQIARIRWLEPSKVNRIEKNGKLAFYTYEGINTTENTNEYGTMTSNEDGQNTMLYKLQPWQIIHFRISDKDFAPYGGSLLKSGVRAYRNFSMLEDAMVIYRLARVPERRVFKVDVGNLSQSEAMRAINKIKDNYRSAQIMDDKGRIDRRAAALSLTQDIFVPTRDGASGTEITTLAPGQALNNIDDIKFFRDEVLWTMNIPPEYLGFSSDQGGVSAGKGSLAMQDVKFARFVERIQYYIEEGLTKIASIELFFKNKKKEDLKNFKIELTPPSNVKEIMDIEYLNQKMNLIQSMLGTNLFPSNFVLEYVMKMSKKEIADIQLFKQIENQKMAAAGGMGGMDMMGGGMPMGGGMDMMGGMPGGDMGAAGGETPMMSVKTETVEEGIDPSKMVKIFGKDFLIEHKEDYAQLVKAAEDYKKEKEEKEKIWEDTEANLSDNEFLTKVRNMLISDEKVKSNQTSMSLINENELGGLNFKNEELLIYTKPKKRTGPKSKKSPDVIFEEKVIKLNNSKKRKVLNEQK